MKVGIETMTVIREWRGVLVNAVKNGYPVTDEFIATYRPVCHEPSVGRRGGVDLSFLPVSQAG
jgi:hypothetical protein